MFLDLGLQNPLIFEKKNAFEGKGKGPQWLLSGGAFEPLPQLVLAGVGIWTCRPWRKRLTLAQIVTRTLVSQPAPELSGKSEFEVTDAAKQGQNSCL